MGTGCGASERIEAGLALGRKYPGLEVEISAEFATRAHRPLYLGKRHVARL